MFEFVFIATILTNTGEQAFHTYNLTMHSEAQCEQYTEQLKIKTNKLVETLSAYKQVTSFDYSCLESSEA